MPIFVPRINLSELGDSIVVKDVSGNYDPTDNPGGYGAQTIQPSYITSAFLYVTPTRTGGQPIMIVVTGTMGAPNTVYQILPVDLGMQRIESELYRIKYVVQGQFPSGANFEYETECDFVALHQAQCCVDKNTAKLPVMDFVSVFRDESSRKLAMLGVWMNRARDARECGNYEAADRMVYHVRLNCSCLNC